MPRNYIPSVEEGVIDALKHGPLGFPVVDVAVKLIDGSYHTVDFIRHGVPHCRAHRHYRRRCRSASRCCSSRSTRWRSFCPSEATAKMNALMSGRRGQILGFDTRAGWYGWDIVKVQMPEAEIGNLIIEVRSATAGVGSFTFKFDHMAEVTRPHRRPDHRRAQAAIAA